MKLLLPTVPTAEVGPLLLGGRSRPTVVGQLPGPAWRLRSCQFPEAVRRHCPAVDLTTSIGERNFKRIGHSPFLRAALLQRFNGRFAKCRCSITDPAQPFSVHHLTYEHSCVFPQLITIQVQRIRRGVEGIYPKKVTECERCSQETPEAFAACMSRVVPLCSGCHFKEHLADILEAKKAKAAGNFDRNLIRRRVNERYRSRRARNQVDAALVADSDSWDERWQGLSGVCQGFPT